MAYGQKNYNEIQGIRGKYRINQIGCLLTAFCNLQERFGRPVDPLSLNRVFRDRGMYIDVDDGIRDDLGYQSITGLDAHTVVDKTFAGNIANNPVKSVNTIVRIKATNRFGTHFCLVAEVRNGIDPLVIDSYDGSFKLASSYGPITGWASYRDIKPQPVVPIAPPPVPVQAPTPVTLGSYDGDMITIQAGWGISHAIKAAGYLDFKSEARWQQVAEMNGSSNWRTFNNNLRPGQRIRVGRPIPTVAAVSTPAEQTVAVRVETPPAPVVDDSWVTTYRPAIGYFVTAEATEATDQVSGSAAIPMPKGQGFRRAGLFEKDGVTYAVTEMTASKYVHEGHLVVDGPLYAVPSDKLTPAADPKRVGILGNVPQPAIEAKKDNELESILDEIKLDDEYKEFKKNLSSRERIVRFVAVTEAAIIKILSVFKFNKNKKG